jgi:hypothetical protein
MGVPAGFIGIHEDTQEVLVIADHPGIASLRMLDRIDHRFGYCSIYLHPVLAAKASKSCPARY